MASENIVVDMGVTLPSPELEHVDVPSLETPAVVKRFASVMPIGQAATGTATGTTTETTDLVSADTVKHYLFKDIEANFNASYNPKESNNSMICDIIAIYIKGQKILYTEAKTHCEQRLTFLMLPAILITVICSVLGVILKDYSYGTTITSSLNGVNAFILALISYLKLDTRAEAHRTSAYKFDKLQSSMEFTSGKMLFVSAISKQLGAIIEDAEKQVREVKETNQFVLPEAIRYAYPKLCDTNVFAIVKKLQNKEMRLTNELKDYHNERLELKKRPDVTVDELKAINTKINETINSILLLKDEYVEIDDTFDTEIAENRNRSLDWRILKCGCLKV
jgi:hypothetical protein